MTVTHTAAALVLYSVCSSFTFSQKVWLQRILNLWLLLTILPPMILLICCYFNVDGSRYFIIIQLNVAIICSCHCCQTTFSSRNTPPAFPVFTQLSQINSAEKVNMNMRTWSRPANFLPRRKTGLDRKLSEFGVCNQDLIAPWRRLQTKGSS